MRVGVYVDAFNLYYGGRSHAGSGAVAGWRWLDVRALASTLVGEQTALWPDARVERVIYCTARVSSRDNAHGHRDQDIYLKALTTAGSVSHIEYGYYTSKVKTRPWPSLIARGVPSWSTRPGRSWSRPAPLSTTQM